MAKPSPPRPAAQSGGDITRSTLRSVLILLGSVTLVIALFFGGLGLWVHMKPTAPPPAPPAAPPQRPVQVLNEKFELKEGAWKGFHLPLRGPTQVAVVVESEGKPVDAMWMDSDNWGLFNRNAPSVHLPSLSEMNTMRMRKSASVPPGDWYLVLRRDKEALLFGHSAVASVQVQELAQGGAP